MEIEVVVYHLVKQIAIQRMLILLRKTGEEKFMYTNVSVPIIGSFTVRLRNDITKDYFTTSGQQMESYRIMNINIHNLWMSLVYQIYRPLQILID